MKNNRQLFLSKGGKYGTASNKYCKQLESVVRKHKEEVNTHMCVERFVLYAFCKGESTYAVSGTTALPSMSAIACRGERSILAVLDSFGIIAL